MARIDFGEGEGLERIRMWSLQPDVGMAMGAANDCTISRTPDPAEDPSHYIHG